ncbi:hypothetical protein Achl_4056 (plasmid) [Pseudarthrobacter chlorophenolicus A6]|uniref:Uncharacterized protein n=1 Tax=Pseudarthrobacter chlorophenolicus (strain ATCC 700700 / DSM 12829 / CIP 107037 / JCM 12360 / KCTC 9906 / NCIMB 13794 / A6) TaxID=452863 RepID=B8HHW0_PSECP|nr:hypothetical protein [Pseudarthrobacter chlorophenolicus]ACL42007.1 hypothetical protein Achl_4056 [Pseudarthrobacter chlorophenolicus A6]SDQ20223.1 hypothetical protein SAMN04489738_0707 [Pseudarthrobacter chlorophenolicus]
MLADNILELVARIQPILSLIGILLVVWAVAKFAFRSARGESPAGIWGQLVMGLVMIVVPMTLPVVANALNGGLGEGEQVQEAPAHEQPAESSPATPADLSWIPALLVGIGVLAALAAIGVGLFHYYSKSLRPAMRKSRSEALTAATLVAEARKTLAGVILDSASYETDLAKQIDYPIMTDVSEPLVGKYVREMRHAQELERALMKKPPLADAERFSSTVTGLKVSYEAAVRRAEKIRWSSFTASEQKRLKDARTALDLIQDASTTPEQRNAQYRRIAKLLDGLIVLTAPVRQSLAAWVPMLALEGPVDPQETLPH